MMPVEDLSGGRICVMGLGNLMCTDDAVGMLAVQLLQSDPRLPGHVMVIEGGTLGLDLLGRLDGVTRLLVLDAVDCGVTPGSVMRFEGEAIRRLPTGRSVHLLGLSDLLSVMLLLDAAPMEVVLLGVQPASTELGTTLTSTVEQALDVLLAGALQQVLTWKVDEKRERLASPGVAVGV